MSGSPTHVDLALLGRLRARREAADAELAEVRREAAAEYRRVVDAGGAPRKAAVAHALGVSRPTLDRWLA